MHHKNIPIKERIIFALDVDSADEARFWVAKLESHIGFYKVGLQLFLAGWWPVIEWIVKRGHQVMVDLKFFDIPETVQRAVRQLHNRGVTFATVHGNDPILRAAVADKNGLKILSVTVLTSFGEEDMREIGFMSNIEDLVLLRAKRALHLGCDGVIASGLEAQKIRKASGDHFFIVTPGIRKGANMTVPTDDQKRIVTAQDAILNGADYVVVGRPIYTAKNPIEIIESMQREIQNGLAL